MPLNADSATVLSLVKESGKPCRFVMISKGAKLINVVAYRRGTDDSRTREAKEAGNGDVACGVVDGKPEAHD